MGLKGILGLETPSREKLEKRLSSLVSCGIDKSDKKAQKAIKICVYLKEHFDSDKSEVTKTIEGGIATEISTRLYNINGIVLSYIESRESMGDHSMPPFSYEHTDRIELSYNDQITKSNAKFCASRECLFSALTSLRWSEWEHKTYFGKC